MSNDTTPASDSAAEALRRALAAGDVEQLAGAETTGATDRLARGLARTLLGDTAGAHRDFDSAVAELGDRALVEIALLDARSSATAASANDLALQILATTDDPFIRARALHASGLAAGRLGEDHGALQALLEAVALFRERRDRVHHAQALDSLGMLLWARGEPDNALTYFAISLSNKALAGDRYGMALTLGNMGRAHLQCGRIREAKECFENDLNIAIELGDHRGIGRMQNDLGRLELDRGRLGKAGAHLDDALATATQIGDVVLQLLVHKDRVRLYLAMANHAAANREIEAAEELAASATSPFHDALLSASRGHLAIAAGDTKSGIQALRRAADTFANELRRPEEEIPLRIELGRAYLATDSRLQAEQQLSIALTRATQDAQRRHLPTIREAMAELALTPGLAHEDDRRRLDVSRRPEDPDGYILLELLGRGGFGEVHRAFDPVRHRIVAIKRLHLQDIMVRRERQRLITAMRTELESAQEAYEHPQIATVLAIGTDSAGLPYIVQEFVEGRSLESTMKSQPDPGFDTVLEIVRGVAHALVALHECGIVHRDIKPSNIMLRSSDRLPILIDFGIAWIKTRADSERQQVQEVLGTPAYMAPELFSTERLPDPAKLDIYALGVLAYGWLVGRLPHEVDGMTPTELRERLLSQRPEPIPGIPQSGGDLIATMLAGDPAERPSAAELVNACDAIRSRVPQRGS